MDGTGSLNMKTAQNQFLNFLIKYMIKILEQVQMSLIFLQVVLQLGMMDMDFMFRQRICMMLSILMTLVLHMCLHKQAINM